MPAPSSAARSFSIPIKSASSRFSFPGTAAASFRTCGRDSRVSRRACRSRADPLGVESRPISRAKSRTSFSATRKSSNTPASSRNPCTASCRAAIASPHRKGCKTQLRSSLPPIAVTVWSMAPIRLVSAPVPVGWSNSRFRWVAASSRRHSSGRKGLGGCRCRAAPFKVSVR